MTEGGVGRVQFWFVSITVHIRADRANVTVNALFSTFTHLS